MKKFFILFSGRKDDTVYEQFQSLKNKQIAYFHRFQQGMWKGNL